MEATDEQNEKSLVTRHGNGQKHRQLLEALTKEGVEVIEALLVNSLILMNTKLIMQVEDSEFESNAVVEEFQKGYKLKDRVIRPSMVKVEINNLHKTREDSPCE